MIKDIFKHGMMRPITATNLRSFNLAAMQEHLELGSRWADVSLGHDGFLASLGKVRTS